MKFYRLSDATFYDPINTMYQFIKPFLDKKISYFEEYGVFKACSVPKFEAFFISPQKHVVWVLIRSAFMF